MSDEPAITTRVLSLRSLRICITFAALQMCGFAHADHEHVKTVLIISPAEVLSPSAQMIDRGMYDVFAESQQKLVILSEHLIPHTEPPTEVELDALALTEKKYRGRHIDLLIARGERALDFVERNGEALWPGIPSMYFSVSDASIYWRDRPRHRSGVFIGHDYPGNVALILQLQPNVKRIVQLVETPRRAEMDAMHMELVAVAKSTRRDLKIETLAETDLPELLKYVAELPEDTALLAMTIDSDRDGVLYATGDIVKTISTSSSVPLYGMRSSYIGVGAVGGQVANLGEHGRQAATLALQLLENPDTGASIQVSQQTRCKVDDRQIHRWQFELNTIPRNCERPYHIPAFWDHYSGQIIAFTTMSSIILALLLGYQLQRRNRMKADEETSRQRTALAHVARLGSVGELTASIVHEINQPLGAILANADAATMMLNKQKSPDCELRAILTDIRDDNLRASQIIQKLRTLLSKRSLESNPLSLNDIVDACKSLLGNLAIRHHAIIQTTLSPNLPLIMGDNTHLQQVLINLVSNAMDAMDTLPPEQRTLSIETKQLDLDHVQLVVSDNGPGIPTNILPSIFESFYTTKPEGMGMGLAIVQTIVEAHHGVIDVLNQENAGASFSVTFPVVRHS